MRFRVVVLVLIAVAGFLWTPGMAVRAENGCPYGYTPWRVPIVSPQTDCLPIVREENSAPPVTPAMPEPQWASRWGAVSIGSTATGGGVGIVTDRESRKAAERAAVQMCAESGGGPLCKSNLLAYHDQCVAIVWGDRSYVVRSAETVAEAAEASLSECNEKTPGCRIFYSGCSLPVRIR